MRRRVRLVALAVGLVATAGFAADGKGTPVKVLGDLSAVAPADWVVEKPANRLRSHQFKLPGAPDHADGELTVSPESNKDVEKQFPKWKATFVPPEGKTADDISKVSKFEAGGATVHLLDVGGTWKYKDRPQAAKEELKDDYRVVWAVVVKGDEATHVRLSGPAPTVDKHYPAFVAWLKGLK